MSDLCGSTLKLFLSLSSQQNAGTREKLGSTQSDYRESTEPEISDVNGTLNDGSVKSLGFQLNSQLKQLPVYLDTTNGPRIDGGLCWMCFGICVRYQSGSISVTITISWEGVARGNCLWWFPVASTIQVRLASLLYMYV